MKREHFTQSWDVHVVPKNERNGKIDDGSKQGRKSQAGRGNEAVIILADCIRGGNEGGS